MKRFSLLDSVFINEALGEGHTKILSVGINPFRSLLTSSNNDEKLPTLVLPEYYWCVVWEDGEILGLKDNSDNLLSLDTIHLTMLRYKDFICRGLKKSGQNLDISKSSELITGSALGSYIKEVSRFKNYSREDLVGLFSNDETYGLEPCYRNFLIKLLGSSLISLSMDIVFGYFIGDSL